MRATVEAFRRRCCNPHCARIPKNHESNGTAGRSAIVDSGPDKRAPPVILVNASPWYGGTRNRLGHARHLASKAALLLVHAGERNGQRSARPRSPIRPACCGCRSRLASSGRVQEDVCNRTELELNPVINMDCVGRIRPSTVGLQWSRCFLMCRNKRAFRNAFANR